MECELASTFFIYLHQLAGKTTYLAGCYLGTHRPHQHGVGLTVTAMADTNTIQLRSKCQMQKMQPLTIRREDFHGEWNTTISPQ
jgi:hypothetical protein